MYLKFFAVVQFLFGDFFCVEAYKKMHRIVHKTGWNFIIGGFDRMAILMNHYQSHFWSEGCYYCGVRAADCVIILNNGQEPANGYFQFHFTAELKKRETNFQWLFFR